MCAIAVLQSAASGGDQSFPSVRPYDLAMRLLPLQMSPAPPSVGGGYRLAGGGRSPSPLRRFSTGGPGAGSGAARAAQLRRRDSTAVSMSIERETPPPGNETAPGQPRRARGRARSTSVHLAPSGEGL